MLFYDYIQQGYPARSPYIGDNSYTPWAQTRQTWTTSAFLGLGFWDGGELYYNPELLQGFGLHDTTGAAGFPNGEAQKSNFAYPRYSTSRLFLRQSPHITRIADRSHFSRPACTPSFKSYVRPGSLCRNCSKCSGCSRYVHHLTVCSSARIPQRRWD